MVAWAVVEWDDTATRIDRMGDLEDEDDGEFYASGGWDEVARWT